MRRSSWLARSLAVVTLAAWAGPAVSAPDISQAREVAAPPGDRGDLLFEAPSPSVQAPTVALPRTATSKEARAPSLATATRHSREGGLASSNTATKRSGAVPSPRAGAIPKSAQRTPGKKKVGGAPRSPAGQASPSPRKPVRASLAQRQGVSSSNLRDRQSVVGKKAPAPGPSSKRPAVANSRATKAVVSPRNSGASRYGRVSRETSPKVKAKRAVRRSSP